MKTPITATRREEVLANRNNYDWDKWTATGMEVLYIKLKPESFMNMLLLARHAAYSKQSQRWSIASLPTVTKRSSQKKKTLYDVLKAIQMDNKRISILRERGVPLEQNHEFGQQGNVKCGIPSWPHGKYRSHSSLPFSFLSFFSCGILS